MQLSNFLQMWGIPAKNDKIREEDLKELYRKLCNKNAKPPI